MKDSLDDSLHIPSCSAAVLTTPETTVTDGEPPENPGTSEDEGETE